MEPMPYRPAALLRLLDDITNQTNATAYEMTCAYPCFLFDVSTAAAALGVLMILLPCLYYRLRLPPNKSRRNRSRSASPSFARVSTTAAPVSVISDGTSVTGSTPNRNKKRKKPAEEQPDPKATRQSDGWGSNRSSNRRLSEHRRAPAVSRGTDVGGDDDDDADDDDYDVRTGSEGSANTQSEDWDNNHKSEHVPDRVSNMDDPQSKMFLAAQAVVGAPVQNSSSVAGNTPVQSSSYGSSRNQSIGLPPMALTPAAVAEPGVRSSRAASESRRARHEVKSRIQWQWQRYTSTLMMLLLLTSVFQALYRIVRTVLFQMAPKLDRLAQGKVDETAISQVLLVLRPLEAISYCCFTLHLTWSLRLLRGSEPPRTNWLRGFWLTIMTAVTVSLTILQLLFFVGNNYTVVPTRVDNFNLITTSLPNATWASTTSTTAGPSAESIAHNKRFFAMDEFTGAVSLFFVIIEVFICLWVLYTLRAGMGSSNMRRIIVWKVLVRLSTTIVRFCHVVYTIFELMSDDHGKTSAFIEERYPTARKFDSLIYIILPIYTCIVFIATEIQFPIFGIQREMRVVLKDVDVDSAEATAAPLFVASSAPRQRDGRLRVPVMELGPWWALDWGEPLSMMLVQHPEEGWIKQ